MPASIKLEDKSDKRVFLMRKHPALGEIVAWHVYSADKKIIWGVIRLVNDPYLERKFGWHRHPVKVWIGSRFHPQLVVVGRTRKQVISRMLGEPE